MLIFVKHVLWGHMHVNQIHRFMAFKILLRKRLLIESANDELKYCFWYSIIHPNTRTSLSICF